MKRKSQILRVAKRSLFALFIYVFWLIFKLIYWINICPGNILVYNGATTPPDEAKPIYFYKFTIYIYIFIYLRPYLK